MKSSGRSQPTWAFFSHSQCFHVMVHWCKTLSNLRALWAKRCLYLKFVPEVYAHNCANSPPNSGKNKWLIQGPETLFMCGKMMFVWWFLGRYWAIGVKKQGGKFWSQSTMLVHVCWQRRCKLWTWGSAAFGQIMRMALSKNNQLGDTSSESVVASLCAIINCSDLGNLWI